MIKYKLTDFTQFSQDHTLRSDFPFTSHFKTNKNNDYYSFNELFDIVGECDNKYLNEDFLYAEIGDVNSNNEVFPNALNFSNRDNDFENESLYVKISKGDIIKCQKNDIIVSKIRPNLNKIVFIENEKEDIYYTSAFICIRPKIIPKLLFYSLRTSLHSELISVARQGKGYPTLNESDLSHISFDKAVIDKLIKNENALLKIIEKKENEIEKLKQQKIIDTEIIDEVFKNKFKFDYKCFINKQTEKIFNQSFAKLTSDEDTRFSCKFHRPAASHVIDELYKIPNKMIRDFIDIPIMTGRGISPKDYVDIGNYQYASMADISSWYLDTNKMKYVSDEYVDKNTQKRPRGSKEDISTTIQPGDILMIRSGEGSIGKVALVEKEVNAIFSDFVIRFRFANYNPKFAYYYFRTTYFQYLIEIYKKGLGNNTNIFPVVLQNFPIPDIPLLEQDEVVSLIDKDIEINKIIEEDISKNRKDIVQMFLNI